MYFEIKQQNFILQVLYFVKARQLFQQLNIGLNFFFQILGKILVLLKA